MPKRAVALMIVAAIAGGSASARAATGSLYAAFDHQFGHDIGIYPLDSSAAMTFITATDPESLTVAGGTLYWIDGVDVKSANLAVNPPGIASVPEVDLDDDARRLGRTRAHRPPSPSQGSATANSGKGSWLALGWMGRRSVLAAEQGSPRRARPIAP